MIPRSLLFGSPDASNVSLSPDGSLVAWLGPGVGAMDLWAARREAPEEARRLTAVGGRGVGYAVWAADGRTLLFGIDRDGREQWRLHAVEVGDGLEPLGEREICGAEGAVCHIAGVSPHLPGTVAVMSNARDRKAMDVLHVDLATGARQVAARNAEGFEAYGLDGQLRARVAVRTEDDGGRTLHVPDGDGWRLLATFDPDDAACFQLYGVTSGGTHAYIADARGRDTAAMARIDLESGATEILAADGACDVSACAREPRTGEVRAIAFAADRIRWRGAGAQEDRVLRALARMAGDADITQLDIAPGGRWWLARADSDTAGGRWIMADAETLLGAELLRERKALATLPLRRMESHPVRTRDGLVMTAYLTRTHAAAAPMVLLVHGGPWSRDSWGFSAEHQFLADRGYHVLSPNFRGSTGFGKAFLNAANRQWGHAMQDDLADAVRWAIAEGIADPARVAIMGTSYGGYAALAGLTFTPELFACGVDLVGPANLITLLESFPDWWAAAKARFIRRMGDTGTEEGRAWLWKCSPLRLAGAVRRPLLMGQGENDPRVVRAESDQFHAALRDSHVPHAYVLFRGEGHGLVRPENRLAWYAMVEAFLAKHLGGTAEDSGDTFTRSTAEFIHS
jgi:dipeptidyl aminopeptidase/acylaminoacyl peptidase